MIITVLLLFTITIIFVIKYPTFFFWLFLHLFFDPGGYITEYFNANIIGLINTSDVFFAGMILAFFLSNKKVHIILQDRLFLRFVKYLIFFYIYYIAVYGGIVPIIYDRFDPIFFLLKMRIYFYAFFILIMVYVFSFDGLKTFYNNIIIIAAIILTLYWITLLTGIGLIPVRTLERYNGSGMIRQFLWNYGQFVLIYAPAIFFFILKRKINIKIPLYKVLLFVGILMISTELLTLSRRVMVSISLLFFSIAYLNSYILKTSNTKNIIKISFLSIFVFLLIWFFNPEYVGFIGRIFNDVYLLITTGVDSRGIEEYRVSQTGGLIDAKKYISENILFGVGYIPKTFQEIKAMVASGDSLGRALRSSGEVAVYAGVLKFGLIGISIFIPIYYKIISVILSLIKSSRRNILWFCNHHFYSLFFIIYFTLILINKFIIQAYSLFQEMVNPLKMNNMLIIAGILFSINQLITKELNPIKE